MQVYKELALRIDALTRCKPGSEWIAKHRKTILEIVADFLPSGAGWDSGTKIEFELCHADRLIFTGDFHHMDANGFYSGWTEHTVTITPSLCHTLHIRVSGRNRNDVKEYLAESFGVALMGLLVSDAQHISLEAI